MYTGKGYNVWQGLRDAEHNPLELSATIARRYPFIEKEVSPNNKLSNFLLWSKLGKIINQELEIPEDQYPLKIRTKNMEKNTVGQYDPKSDSISLNRNELNAPDMPETMLHESMHRADQFLMGQGPEARQRDSYKMGHFNSNTIDNTANILQSLKQQEAIEMGLPPDPYTMQNMPWLKKVQPLSSNPLANPWVHMIDEANK
jgi:hypothetical protein